jgi:hypothetical protein
MPGADGQKRRGRVLPGRETRCLLSRPGVHSIHFLTWASGTLHAINLVTHCAQVL